MGGGFRRRGVRVRFDGLGKGGNIFFVVKVAIAINDKFAIYQLSISHIFC